MANPGADASLGLHEAWVISGYRFDNEKIATQRHDNLRRVLEQPLEISRGPLRLVQQRFASEPRKGAYSIQIGMDGKSLWVAASGAFVGRVKETMPKPDDQFRHNTYQPDAQPLRIRLGG
jgi:hypothetical protein